MVQSATIQNQTVSIDVATFILTERLARQFLKSLDQRDKDKGMEETLLRGRVNRALLACLDHP
jgi:hypothetical protein